MTKQVLRSVAQKTVAVSPNGPRRESATNSRNTHPSRRLRVVRNPLDEMEFLAEEKNSTVELEAPESLLRMLAPAVIEVIAGVRNINQLGAILSEDVFTRLRDRSVLMAQVRARNGEGDSAPQLTVGDVRVEHLRDGVVESVVLVQSPNRTRAVTIRLEGINRRWRAQAVSVI